MKNYIYQNVKELAGVTEETIVALGITEEQIWTPAELSTINNFLNSEKGEVLRNVLWNGMEEGVSADLVKFINNKRVLAMNVNGESRFVAIPSNRGKEDRINSINKSLLNLSLTYYRYKIEEDVEAKQEQKEHFDRQLDMLNIEIAKKFLSKQFKDNYQFRFRGFNSVTLTGHLSPDGVAIPKSVAEKLGVEVGDLCILKRDPLQNIFITLKVEKFHEEPVVRLNPQTYLLVDGDFDGDQASIIPVKTLLKDNKKFIGSRGEEIIKELEELIPSKIMNNSKFDVLTREYQEPFREVTEPVKTYSEILHSSKKSMKFAGTEIDEQGHLSNHLENVRNMITVKEGTAVAGSFCNWIMECARNYGLNMVTARGLSNRVQRVALDSKHTTGIANYTELEWYRIVDLRRRGRFSSAKEVETLINQIINGEKPETKEDKKTSNSFSKFAF